MIDLNYIIWNIFVWLNLFDTIEQFELELELF